MQVLQGKLRRVERLLEQKEIRITMLQSRCRRLEKEHGKVASKPQSQQQLQPDVNKHT